MANNIIDSIELLKKINSIWTRQIQALEKLDESLEELKEIGVTINMKLVKKDDEK